MTVISIPIRFSAKIACLFGNLILFKNVRQNITLFISGYIIIKSYCNRGCQKMNGLIYEHIPIIKISLITQIDYEYSLNLNHRQISRNISREIMILSRMKWSITRQKTAANRSEEHTSELQSR